MAEEDIQKRLENLKNMMDLEEFEREIKGRRNMTDRKRKGSKEQQRQN